MGRSPVKLAGCLSSFLPNTSDSNDFEFKKRKKSLILKLLQIIEKLIPNVHTRSF